MLRKTFFALIILFSAFEINADIATEEKVQKDQLKQLRHRIDNLQNSMQSSQGERSELSKALRKSEKEIGSLARRLRVLKGRLKRQQVRLQGLQKQANRQSNSLKQEQKLFVQQIRAAYAMGRQEKIKIFLNQQDPAIMARTLVYYDYLNRERIRRIDAINQKLDNLRDTQQEISKEETKLQSLVVQQIDKQQQVAVAQLSRQKILDNLNSEIQGQGNQLVKLQSNEKQLQSLLGGLQEALIKLDVPKSKQKRFTQLQGKMKWPTKGIISRSFGTPKIGLLRWDGVMIAAKEGSEVKSIHPGRVAFADWLRGFGLLLIVDHGDGYMTLYGHNQSLFKEVGDFVETGEPVAAVGNTGGRKSHGVYFAIRHQGKAVNPKKWCRKSIGKRVG